MQAVGLEDTDYPVCAAAEDELLADTETGRQGHLWEQRELSELDAFYGPAQD